ncbi:actin cortical patch SUR7/pH-response regulator pali [Cantharellus anzutake]|uniref:actin cortical patch SUR7/pH-response regulator pali n=1 Tax=Cantharellus anzutake TaxID=1750568 RepID=UPI001902EB75|nr:actin cortical patch SUR7/pH-response regulator pali [Cantharellus anzutake]KAF8344081.1 actin cortical patch SUR7/pH-response regulator pali [Cantharellus anzutake]
MRGEVCIGTASLLSFIATLLLMFAHIGSTNHNAIARGIGLITVNVSSLAAGLVAATGDQSPGFYSNTPQDPLGQHRGVRRVYQWGFYGYCGFIDRASGAGVCTAEGNSSFGYPFNPKGAIIADAPANYTTLLDLLIQQPTPFGMIDRNKSTSVAGFAFIFIGSLSTALAFLTGLIRNSYTFSAALVLSIFGAFTTLIGAAIWTALIGAMKPEGNIIVATNTKIGITTAYGTALWLIWTAWVAMLLSIAPYFLTCYTYLRRRSGY